MRNGRATRILTDSRPSAERTFTCRRTVSRSLTVSATVSRISARFPPTSRWTFTAMMAHLNSSVPTRSARAFIASSTGLPSRTSATTRENSGAVGFSDLLGHRVESLEEAVTRSHRARQDRHHVWQLAMKVADPLVQFEAQVSPRDAPAGHREDQGEHEVPKDQLRGEAGAKASEDAGGDELAHPDRHSGLLEPMLDGITEPSGLGQLLSGCRQGRGNPCTPPFEIAFGIALLDESVRHRRPGHLPGQLLFPSGPGGHSQRHRDEEEERGEGEGESDGHARRAPQKRGSPGGRGDGGRCCWV